MKIEVTMSEHKMGGLAGVVAGQTAISMVDKNDDGLTYRGYKISELVKQASFEEVAYLLIYENLPNKKELNSFNQQLVKFQSIPTPIITILEQLPASSLPMDVLRTSCSALGSIEPESISNNQQTIATRLIPYLISCMFYWYYFSSQNKRINVSTGQTSLSGHILALLNQAAPDRQLADYLNTSLILYAEHEFNASTFTARVCVATGADMYGPITAAIAALSGPLHGGANEAALFLITKFDSPEAAAIGIKQMLLNKELIMGFGHRVYKICDPRSQFIKDIASNITTVRGKKLFAIAEVIEKIMWDEKKLFPNLDFYSSLVYDYLGFPANMFTPIFVFARLPGWSAHIFEQRAHNRLIRPDAEYIGPATQDYIALEDRHE